MVLWLPRESLLAILILVLVSPIFGVILADLVGFHEPLDLAAEALGLEEAAEAAWAPFPDYTVPGLPDDVGYIVAGLIGVGIIIAIGYAATRLVA